MPCADCGQTRVVMLAMQPGKDGEPWEICSRCYGGSVPAPVNVPLSASAVGWEREPT